MSSMSDPVIGREIGSYQIVAVLGHGGMGKVYRAQHPYIGKQVAVKFLKPELSSKADSVQRFFQEARAVNDIHHENVIDVLDFGRTQDGEYFILMELLQGKTLGDVIKGETPFPLKRLCHVGLQICSALCAAHEKSIIHRDLKPDNIFLITRAGQKDFVKVLDFGLAKLVDDSAGTHTTTGMVMGTPLYMAPEQALGRPLDAQTDVYALGVILYQMATGTVPFFDPNPVALATMHVTAKVPKPSERHSSVDPKLEKIILRCLEKEKEKRYSSMIDVALDLSSVLNIDTTPYFGRDLKESSSSHSEGDELPTVTDADRTMVTNNPIKPSPSAENTLPSEPGLELKIPAEPYAPISETSNLRAEITGKNPSSKTSVGLWIGAALLLLLGFAAFLAFYPPSQKTQTAPANPVPVTQPKAQGSADKTNNEPQTPTSQKTETPASQNKTENPTTQEPSPKNNKIKNPTGKDNKENKDNKNNKENKNPTQPEDPKGSDKPIDNGTIPVDFDKTPATPTPATPGKSK